MFTSVNRSARATSRFGALTLAALLSSCGGGGDHYTPAPPSNPGNPGGSAGPTYDVILLGAPRPGSGNIDRRGIADGGIVAGTSSADPDALGRAFLYNGKTEIDIGTLGGGFARATGVNRCGQVTGWSTRADGTAHAFLYDGSMHDLGTLGGSESFGLAINNCGKVTGWAVAANGQTHAFLYDGKAMQDLGSFLGQSSGEAINDVGQVVGAAYERTGGLMHAFLYDSRTGGPMLDLHTLGFSSFAVDINNAGQVVGGWREAGDTAPLRGFYYEAGVMRDIGTLGGDFTVVNDINNAGIAVGVSALADRTERGFVYDGTTMTSIGTLPTHRLSYAAAINASGLVVGNSSTGISALAISWTRKDGIVDLNTRLHAPPPGLVLTEAVAVADDGNIAVQTNHGFALLKVRR
jgi:probable HAF family extracellular repeat protein